jgi:hypothetical protein
MIRGREYKGASNSVVLYIDKGTTPGCCAREETAQYKGSEKYITPHQLEAQAETNDFTIKRPTNLEEGRHEKTENFVELILDTKDSWRAFKPA